MLTIHAQNMPNVLSQVKTGKESFRYIAFWDALEKQIVLQIKKWMGFMSKCNLRALQPLVSLVQKRSYTGYRDK